MSLGMVAMEVFNERTIPDADAALLSFGHSAAGVGLVAGACMLPAHAGMALLLADILLAS